MIEILLSLLGILLILIASEVLWRREILEPEMSRKFVHITVGAFVAFWPFYMPMEVIFLLAVAMFIVVALSRWMRLFESIHGVKRRTWGELFFPIAIAITAALAPAEWVFTAAILHLSLADGLAAVVGTRMKRPGRYKLFDQPKSVAGTLAFFLTSVVITATYFYVTAGSVWAGGAMLVWLPLLAAIIENIGLFGLDDLFVPIWVALVLGAV